MSGHAECSWADKFTRKDGRYWSLKRAAKELGKSLGMKHPLLAWDQIRTDYIQNFDYIPEKVFFIQKPENDKKFSTTQNAIRSVANGKMGTFYKELVADGWLYFVKTDEENLVPAQPNEIVS